MKSILRTAAAGLAVAAAGISAPAFAATETATAEADIIAALDVSLDGTRNRLDFGTIAESGSGGTVTLTPAGGYTCGSGLVCNQTGAMTPNFDIDGEIGATVNISVPASITLTSGGNTMNVALSSSAASLLLDGSGLGTFDVGGTLTIGANQAVGSYTNTTDLVVTVVYN